MARSLLRLRAMKLLQRRSSEVVEARLETTAEGESLLVVGERRISPLAALEEGLVLLDASDDERKSLVEAGYALPAEPVPDDDEGEGRTAERPGGGAARSGPALDGGRR